MKRHLVNPTHSGGDELSQKLEPLLNEKEAAEVLGVSISFLQNDRCGLRRIAYVKIGRCARYRRADLNSYINANTVAAQN
jgi:predicted nucleotidyltransferase